MPAVELVLRRALEQRGELSPQLLDVLEDLGGLGARGGPLFRLRHLQEKVRVRARIRVRVRVGVRVRV